MLAAPVVALSGRWERRWERVEQGSTHFVGISIGGSSLVKYAVRRAAVAESLFFGSKCSRPSARSLAAGESHLILISCHALDLSA